MPEKINTYYEPFLGGGSVLIQLLKNDRQVSNYICSDINFDLISLWKAIKLTPYKLYVHYKTLWEELNMDQNIPRKKQLFNKIRKRFNKDKNSSDFLFLLRTCVNGLVRYNSKGEFNTSLHLTRPGINPQDLFMILMDYCVLIRNVEFRCFDFCNIVTSENDCLYVDPPYYNTKGMYYGKLSNYEILWNWLRIQKGFYILSFDSIEQKSIVPKEVFTKHVVLDGKRSSLSDLHGSTGKKVFENLYVK